MLSRNKQILKHFPNPQSWKENYKIIINLGKKLQKFNEEDRKEKWLIKACQSPLWLKADFNSNGKVILTGESLALITKGLLALVIEFYTNRKPEDILKDKPEFITSLNLSNYLTSQRTNGLQALLNQIINYAQAFLLLSQNKFDK
ncbi:MAG: SufE family protein [Bdellovibrionales bacterium]|nr:SufE family protein [Bdellovibrionales bacterium]